MRKISSLLVFLVFFCSPTTAADFEVFSEYRGPFVLQKVDFKQHEIHFSGKTVLIGEIQFRFDRLDENRFGEPLFAKFIPDPGYLDWFPTVVSGFYPGKLDSIGLRDEMAVLNVVFGPEMVKTLVPGNRPVLSVRGRVTLTNYVTSVECDSRQYSARLETFEHEGADVASFTPTEIFGGC